MRTGEGRQVVVAGAVRTPCGNLNGILSSFSAPALGSLVIKEAVARAGIKPADVEEVFMGNVLSAGLGQAPARQAAKGAGLPDTVGATTVNKVCGSGLKAVVVACQAIRSGDAEIIVAGGMESMSRAPYLLDKARLGYRLGHGELIDSMIKDGLWDVYKDMHMGLCGELCAAKYRFSRQEQDDFAVQSYNRAQWAQQKGWFREEIVQIDVPAKPEPFCVVEDERPKRLDRDKLRRLSPAFQPDGTITAGNASGINDAAAALVVLSEERARASGIAPVAKILGYTQKALEPEWFTLAPITAIQAVCKALDLRAQDIDLFEINEAFAVVPLAAIKELGLSRERVNVQGGAIALGHPIGASGARILTTLIYALKRTGGKRGVASICIGGGEALALAIEVVPS